jgi:hypothetical protein
MNEETEKSSILIQPALPLIVSDPILRKRTLSTQHDDRSSKRRHPSSP